MLTNMRLMEDAQIVMAIVPVDSQTGANTGDYVSLKYYSRCAVVLIKAAGIAGDDPVFTMTQAQDVGGTGVKNLTFTDVYSKVGAQTGIGTFTKSTQAAAATYTDAVSAEAQAIMVVEFKASDLDIDNGFDCLKLSIPDTGSGGAQLIAAFYILYNGKYDRATPLSAIID